MKIVLTLFLGFLLFAPAMVVLAQAPETQLAQAGFVQCEGKNCSACDLVVLANNGVKWLITISFLFFAILAVRAGIKLVISQGNPGALQDAKSSFTNAFIGLVIILVAWLMVDTIMRELVKGNGNIAGYGPWSEVRCSSQEEVGLEEGYFEGDALYEPPSYYSDSQVAISSGVPSGEIQSKIIAATLRYQGASTASGPSGGKFACAWAINNILRSAGVGTVDGDSVREMEKVLVSGRGKRISQSDAGPGDLVLLLGATTKSGKTGNHVGVCLNSGCTSVLSNSSSKATFSWQSGPTFTPSYSNATPRFYRVTS